MALIIIVITLFATLSVVTGLERGIKELSRLAFALSSFLMMFIMLTGDTVFQLNLTIQTMGYYIWYLPKIAFHTDAFELLDTKEYGNGGFETQGAKAWMDTWTIFYWGWWISWAPFVGTFLAKISRGRTVGQVIKGAFIAPVLFSFLWLTIFGSLGIKMQRASEMALDVAVDKYDWSIDCATHYTDNAPSSEKAMALADKGYYLLSCRGTNDRILDVMEPYGKLTPFMHLLTLVGITLYFVTSSDSGSFVDDIISAQGHENPPWIQRVYWAVTEGATAQALLSATDSGLSTIQAVSIVAGLPYTIAICYCCTSLYRALKREMRDEDIMSQRHGFVVSSLDILELYSPEDMPAQSPSSGERFKSNVIALFFPYKGLKTAACAYPASAKVPPLSRGCCTSSSSRKLRLFDTTSELRAASEITSCTTCSHRALCIR